MDWSGYERSGYGLEETGYDMLEEEEEEDDEGIEDEEEEEDEDNDDDPSHGGEDEETSMEYAKPTYSVYKRKYQLLMERMAAMNQENEIIVYRISKLKKILAAGAQERSFLMSELDKRGDNYRGIPVTANPYQEAETKKKETGGGGSDKKGRKIKAEKDKQSRDPNLPKRPQNPFFQYCKEQRECVSRDEYEKEGTQLSKKELTKLLAQKWNALNSDQKQIYTDRFEEERAGYNIKMETYRRLKEESSSGHYTPIKKEKSDPD